MSDVTVTVQSGYEVSVTEGTQTTATVTQSAAQTINVETGGVSQSAADTRYVNVSGDTMTGDLTVPNLTITGELSVGEYWDGWSYASDGDIDSYNHYLGGTVTDIDGDSDAANLLVTALVKSETTSSTDHLINLLAVTDTATDSLENFHGDISGIRSDIEHSSLKTVDRIDAVYSCVMLLDGSGDVSAAYGSYGYVVVKDGAGTGGRICADRKRIYYFNDAASVTEWLSGRENDVYIYSDSPTIPAVYGNLSKLGFYGASTITTAINCDSQVDLTSGTIGDLYHFKATTTNSTTGVTNAYGLYVGDLVGMNTWGIYQAGADDDNYFAGKVAIGTTALATLLNVAGAITLHEIAAPSTPATDTAVLYLDSADGSLKIKFDTGNVVTIATYT